MIYISLSLSLYLPLFYYLSIPLSLYFYMSLLLFLHFYLYLSLPISIFLLLSLFIFLSLCLLISLSHYLSLDLSRPNRGIAKASRGRHGAQGGGVDVNKITSSNWSISKLGLFQFLNLAIDTDAESWLGISSSKVASSAVCVSCF